MYKLSKYIIHNIINAVKITIVFIIKIILLKIAIKLNTFRKIKIIKASVFKCSLKVPIIENQQLI